MKNRRIIEEDNELILDILERNYFSLFRSLNKNTEKSIELIFNRKAKQDCYGCHSNTELELYPGVDWTTTNYDKVMKNFDYMIKWYNQNKFRCNVILNGLDLLNTNIDLNSFFNKVILLKNRTIILKTTLDFLNNEEISLEIDKYDDLCKDYNINLIYEIYGINGYYCDLNKYTDDFYNKAINFIKTHNCIWELYISSNNVEYWIQNFKWIISLGFNDKIKINVSKDISWNKNSISDLIDFINFLSDYMIETHPHIKDQLDIIYFNKENNIYNLITLSDNNYLVNKNNNCGFFKNLTIDLESLAIVPCPKINYPDFYIGKFIIEQDSIVKIEALTLELIIYNTHIKQVCMPHCEKCGYVNLCSGHCLAESYNKCYNLLCPTKEFCSLTYSIINFLVYKYQILELLNGDILNNLQCSNLYKTNLFNIMKGLRM